MRRALVPVKRFAVLCHRWMGVVFCLLFAWWFVSGIFMMYWDYPSVREQDRLRRSLPLDPAQVKLSASEAYARLNLDRPPRAVRLAMFDGRPAYFFGEARGRRVTLYADNGEVAVSYPPELNRRSAAAWSGLSAPAAEVEILIEPDQWTVQGSFRGLRPLEKYSWPDGQQVYVSRVTGEVVQYTTRSSRLFAHLGAIPHWLYYTPLRKNGLLWSTVVIWLSALATLAAALGLVVGIWMYSPSKRYRLEGEATSIPYSGQKRVHMIFGLFFGIVACTWAFSGMLSMDPFPASARVDAARTAIADSLRGPAVALSRFDAKHPREAIAQVAAQWQVKELAFSSFDAEPVYIATGDASQSRIVPMHGEPQAEFDRARMVDLVRGAAGAEEVRFIDEYDAYYLDRGRERPLPVLCARLKEARYYIDSRTARIVGSYNSASWVNRWLYHGLHSLNFPWLYNHRPVWDIAVLVLMLGGCALSVTAVVIAFQLLRKQVARVPDSEVKAATAPLPAIPD